MKFYRVIANDKSFVHAEGQGQGWLVKVTGQNKILQFSNRKFRGSILNLNMVMKWSKKLDLA